MPKYTEYYDILGVETIATPTQIRTAYKKRALATHPDKGGSEEMFNKVGEAYNTLSDPEKRKIYDLYGKQSEENHMVNMTEIFTKVYGVYSHFKSCYNRPPDVVHVKIVSLEDLHSRKTLKFRLKRNRFCTCNSIEKICDNCSGSGVIASPSLYGVCQNLCPVCQGEGIVHAGCKLCTNGYIQEAKIFEIHLAPTIPNNFQYMFRNDGHQKFGYKEAGNLIIEIQYERHPIYRVISNHLATDISITLKEALCGVKKTIIHPSSENIEINTEGMIISPTNREITLPGKGMTSTGDMFIFFNIIFPTELSRDQIELLKEKF